MKQQRREKALKRLENQLVSGVKPNKVKLSGNSVNIPLTDSDKKRIENEILTLKSKI